MKLEIRDLTLGYNNKEIISGMNRSLDAELIGITGNSGSGKSTLLKGLAGLITPIRGEIIGLEGKRLSMVFQEDRLINRLTLSDNVALVTGSRGELAEKVVESALETVELTMFKDVLVSKLSGGMQRRASIARAIAYGGDVLLMDEPYKGLDAKLRERVAQRIAYCFETIIIVTHSIEEIELTKRDAAKCEIISM